MKVLRHHDLGQMAIGLLRALFHLLQIVHHAALGHGGHRILDEFCTHGTSALGQRILAVLRHLDLTQYLVGSFPRQTGDIGQAALRIGKLPCAAAQTVRIAKLIERVMQLAREHANLVVDVGGGLVAAHGSEIEFLDDEIDLLFQRGLGEGLDDIAGRSALGGSHDIFLAGFGGHHQYRQMLELFILLDFAQQLKAVHVRHVDVGHHEVKLASTQLGDGNHTIFGFIGIGEATLLEQIAHDTAHGGEVVNNQKSQGISHERPFRSE
ncbi:hypothetical protein SDC9_120453 [bioreactor metagenome]|uniref:Uncharacterized protein n=1 Tax=bioreactor metagenome TaxID=1076179 RepID=A0A645C9A5_9ZZZZ